MEAVVVGRVMDASRAGMAAKKEQYAWCRKEKDNKGKRKGIIHCLE